MGDDGPDDGVHDERRDARSDDVPVQPVDRRSEWSFEWSGVVPVVLIVAVAFIGWRWLGDGGSVTRDGADGAVAATTTGPVATTSTATTATTTAPTTTVPATTTTVRPEPRVIITGEMKPCRYGDNCLVADFTIEGFDDPPDRFTCIYPNSRRDFTFRDGGKEDACLTADAGDTITIEVGGVTSATISEERLDGSPGDDTAPDDD